MAAVRDWLEGKGMDERPPDEREVSRGHGRLEERALWLVESEELGAYLEQEYGWPGWRWCGRIQRRRRKGTQAEWEEEETLWVAGGNLAGLTAWQALEALRSHWEIENKLFWVRDGTMDEDRLHGRAMGLGLSEVRNAVLHISCGRWGIDTSRTGGALWPPAPTEGCPC